MTTYDVDVVVVGLGPGGEYAAQKLADAGLDVVGVERDLVGGECPFYGCIPSKMMIRAADLLGEAGRIDHLAGHAEVTPDWATVAHRIDKQATNHWQDDSHVERLEEAGVRIVRGTGTLDGPGRVRVGEDTYVGARGVVLGVGTSPATLPIDGLDATPYWTNREIVKVADLPRSPGGHRRRPDRLRARPGVLAVRGRGHRPRGRRPAPRGGGARVQRPADQGLPRRGDPGRDRARGAARGPRAGRLPDHHRPRRRGRRAAARGRRTAAQPAGDRSRHGRPGPGGALGRRWTRGCGPGIGSGPSATSRGTAPSPTCRCTRARSRCATSSTRTASPPTTVPSAGSPSPTPRSARSA